MPLPLPDLDTRHWSDLVEEGRALIPRYAPEWTDHNIHDPGITLIELFAWLIEQGIYRLNRIPECHRRKFLKLIGYKQRPPRPAKTALTFRLKEHASELTLPIGTTVVTCGGSIPSHRFRTLAPLTVTSARIEAIQVFDGKLFLDQNRRWEEGLDFPLLGSDPGPANGDDSEHQPAFYIGFDQALPENKPIDLWFWFRGSQADLSERERIIEETNREAEERKPILPCWSCPQQTEEGRGLEDGDENGGEWPVLPPHHAVRTVWEYYREDAWHRLDPEAGEVKDDTRGFTLNGAVHLALPRAMESVSLGVVPGEHYYLRCRLVDGRPDTAPVLHKVVPHSVLAEQVSPIWSTFQIRPGVTPPPGQEPVVGKRGRLYLQSDGEGGITDLAMVEDVDAPEVLVLDYQSATGDTPGALTITLELIGWGTGLPGQHFLLAKAPIAHGQVGIWTIEDDQLGNWRQRLDFDSSKRTDADFTLDATTGEVSFGDGERGRVVPERIPILATSEVTAGAAGNIASGVEWKLAGVDEVLNRAVLGEEPSAIAERLESILNLEMATGGMDEEELAYAIGRATEAYWAHERLVELCPSGQSVTLDQIDRSLVLERIPPWRATALLDFERLALDVPGTHVVRARAWAGLDPTYPCFRAPGVVTVVIVPDLPRARPYPTPGLLRRVYCYLERRKVIGTRLFVVGPTYLEVAVNAKVRMKPTADPGRVQEDILHALNTFLDPLQGGPNGRGWPFGRDVYRSEVLQKIDEVPGVDHVLSLELVPGEGEAQCGNLCVAPLWLLVPGQHKIEVI